MNNLILSGGIFHSFKDSSKALADLLSSMGIRSETFEDIDEGLQQLASGRFQMLTVNALRWQMLGQKYDSYREQWAYSLSPAQRELIASHVYGGGGLLAMHTASICFDDWPEWGNILGGHWQWGKSWHPPPQSMRARVTRNFAALRTDELIELEDELYSDLHCLSDIDVVLESVQTELVPQPQPLAWQRSYGAGRVFVDLLGHDAESIIQPQHALLIQASTSWLCGAQQIKRSASLVSR